MFSKSFATKDEKAVMRNDFAFSMPTSFYLLDIAILVLQLCYLSYFWTLTLK